MLAFPSTSPSETHPLRQRLLGRREVGPAHVELDQVTGTGGHSRSVNSGGGVFLVFFLGGRENDVEQFLSGSNPEKGLAVELGGREEALERRESTGGARRKRTRARGRLSREPVSPKRGNWRGKKSATRPSRSGARPAFPSETACSSSSSAFFSPITPSPLSLPSSPLSLSLSRVLQEQGFGSGRGDRFDEMGTG